MTTDRVKAVAPSQNARVYVDISNDFSQPIEAKHMHQDFSHAKMFMSYITTLATAIANRVSQQPLNHRLPVSWATAGLLCSLIIPSIAIVHKYFATIGVALYCIMCSSVLIVGCKVGLPKWVERMPRKYVFGLSSLTFGVLSILFVVVYPIVNEGILGGSGSDSDDALNIATQALLAGEYPYYQQTYLENPLTPLPGLLILATPSVIMGNSAYMGIVSLVVFFVVMWVFFHKGGSSLLSLWVVVLFSPAVLHNLITGSDYLFNTVYLFAMSFVALKLAENSKTNLWLVAGSAIFLGLGFSSRLNFIFILPLLASGLLAARGWKYSIYYILLVVATFIAVTLPFYLYDPSGFSPLHTSNKLTRLNTVLPFASILIILLSLISTIWLALQPGNHYFAVFCRRAALVLAIPILGGIIFMSINQQVFDPSYAFFGTYFLFFGVFAYWNDLVENNWCQRASSSNDHDSIHTVKQSET